MSEKVVREYVVARKGRDSKYSSKVYVINQVLVDATPDLDEWFGPIDDVARKKELDAAKASKR